MIEPSPAWRALFRQKWWLDAVAPRRWSESFVGGADEPLGHLAWSRRKDRWGFVHLDVPPLTRLGPWVARSPEPKAHGSWGRDSRVVRTLIGQLPHADRIAFTFPVEDANWLPFHWSGFTAGARCTYVLPSLASTSDLWERCTDKTRNAIRRGGRSTEVRDDLDPAVLVGLVSQSLTRQGAADPELSATALRVTTAALAQGAGRALYAVDPAGTPTAAVFVAWDDTTSYYLLGGASDQGRATGAMSALLWEAIALSRDHAASFDFEGSMIESIEHFFRGFGAVQKQLVSVERCSGRYEAARALRRLGALGRRTGR
ncbi:MAG: GNAT family N-acetyltransferase [Actinomycetota bacterium]|nr:GNAT family N-acetyltransferase [Actinomycetota bacterium]